jgi:cation:H+ antiporter
MLQSILFLVAGLFIVVKGADWLVEGASSLARRIGVSELAIGLTVVAFGTSMPELSVNLLSALNGSTDIAIGNIVSSNIANILLILGIAAIISPMTVQTSTVWKEIPFSLLAAVLVLIMANDHIIDGLSFAELTRSDGLSLIAFFLIFLWYTFGMSRVDDGTAA